MNAILALLLALAGFAGLALAMPRHARQAGFGDWAAARAGRLRALGWAALAGSLALRLATPLWRIALVEWVGEAALAAALIALLLALAPKPGKS